jgi:hypothetical protein
MDRLWGRSKGSSTGRLHGDICSIYNVIYKKTYAVVNCKIASIR